MNPLKDETIAVEYAAVSPRDFLDIDELHSISKPDNIISFFYVANHLFWLFLCGVSFLISMENDNFLSAFIAYFFYCAVFNFLSTTGAMHEFCHGRVFSSVAVNRRIYKALGYMTWINPSMFKLSHFNHHRNFLSPNDIEGQVGNADKPTLRQAVKKTMPDPVMMARTIYYNGLTALGIFRSKKLQYLIRDPSAKIQVRLDASMIFVFHLTVAMASYLLATWYPVVLVSLPSFCGRYLSYVLASSQHNVRFAKDTCYNQISASVSIKIPTVLRMLYWNMNFHAEHHLCPAVPHHNLPIIYGKLCRNESYVSIHNSTDLLKEIKGDFVQR